MPNYDQVARTLQGQLNDMLNEEAKAESEFEAVARELEKAESGTRRRDRNRFLLLFLNGDHEAFNKIRPRRQRHDELTKRMERLGRQITATDKEIYRVLDEKLSASDPEYQSLQLKKATTQRTVDSCRAARATAARAQNEAGRASSREPTDAKVVPRLAADLLRAIGEANKLGHLNRRQIERLKSGPSGQRELKLLVAVAKELQADLAPILTRASEEVRAHRADLDQRLRAAREQLSRDLPSD